MNKINRLISYIVIFFFTFGIYLSFFSKKYSQDVFLQASAIQSASPSALFDTSHILSGYLLSLLWNFILLLNNKMDVLFFLQVTNAVIGVAILLLFYRLLSDVIGDSVISIPVTLGLAFSYEFWFYSVSGKAGLFGILFLMICLVIIWKTLKKNRIGLWFFLGSAHALAVALQKQNIAFILVALLNIFLIKDSLLNRIKSLAVYLLALTALSFGIYSGMGHVAHKEIGLPGIIGQFSPVNIRDIFHIPGSFLLVKETLFNAHKAVISSDVFFNRINNLQLDFFTAFLFSQVLLIAVGFIYLSFVLVKDIRAINRSYGKIFFICLVFIVSFGAVSLFWDNDTHAYGIKSLIPIWLVAGLVIAHLRNLLEERILIFVFIIPLVLFTVNFFGDFLPNSKEKNIDEFQCIYFLDDYMGKNDALLMTQGFLYKANLKDYVKYFMKNNVLYLDAKPGSVKAGDDIKGVLKRKDRVFWLYLKDKTGKNDSDKTNVIEYFRNSGLRASKINLYRSRTIYGGSSLYAVER